MQLHSFPEIELLGDADIRIHEGRRDKVITAVFKIDSIESKPPGHTRIFGNGDFIFSGVYLTERG